MSTPGRQLRIVHVVFSSRVAGGEHHCIDLAHAQADLGHEVHLVGPRRSAIIEHLRPGIRYHGFALPFLRGLRLNRLINRLDADVCHGHLGPACKAVAHAPLAARIGTLHVGYKAHQHGRLDGVVCVNKAQFAQLGQFGGPARVIHNWAPLRPQSPTASDLRAELSLRPEQLLVGSVGRLHPAKGMDILVAAFKKHAPADAVLAILGEGEGLGALTQLADNDPSIRFLGFRRDVDTALKAMDLFVSPSREEAFPLAVLEAMRAGLPIIATMTQGPVEMLADQPGQLTPIGDVDALGQAMLQRLTELRQVPRDRRVPVAYDLGRYDRAVAVAAVTDFYQEVIAQRQTSGEQQQRLEQAGLHA